jgi:hypothetical protein
VTAETATRRERQLAEILHVAADGDHVRASGLVAEHLREFPADVDALGRIAAWLRRFRPPDGARAGQH